MYNNNRKGRLKLCKRSWAYRVWGAPISTKMFFMTFFCCLFWYIWCQFPTDLLKISKKKKLNYRLQIFWWIFFFFDYSYIFSANFHWVCIPCALSVKASLTEIFKNISFYQLIIVRFSYLWFLSIRFTFYFKIYF